MADVVQTSKFLSFVLRHKPEAIGLVLDSEGWADIDVLIAAAMRDGKKLDRALIGQVGQRDPDEGQPPLGDHRPRRGQQPPRDPQQRRGARRRLGHCVRTRGA